jgi:prepilin-type N-terminal cleavage/methylation domain-containing protein
MIRYIVHIKSCKSAGFSLLEMVIVLIMVGILTASLAPVLLRQNTGSQEARDRIALEEAKTAIINYAITYGGIPNPLNEAGVPCAVATQINPVSGTMGVGMMPPQVSCGSNTVPALLVNNWGAFGDVNNLTANYLQTFQLDVSDALLSYPVLLAASTTPAYTGGDRVTFCQVVGQQLSSGYCTNGTSPTVSACVTAGYDWIAGGYCYNNSTQSVIASAIPATCTAPNVWYAAPQLCQDSKRNHISLTSPDTVCTSYAPVAFVLYSTGNNRKPDQGNDQGSTKLGTNPIGASRIYENDARSINTTAGPDYYDDQVISYPLTAMARDCREKMNVLPEAMSCKPGNKYIGMLTNPGTTRVYFGISTSQTSVPSFVEPSSTMNINTCYPGNNYFAISGVIPASMVAALDANRDGRVDAFASGVSQVTGQ